MIVIGGGDTGADCIGTSLRHGATSIVNFELLDQPPAERAEDNPWPQWPRVYRLDYSHEETAARLGADPRQYHLLTKEFLGDDQGQLTGVKTVAVDWSKPGQERPLYGSGRERKNLAGRPGLSGHRFCRPRVGDWGKCSGWKRKTRAATGRRLPPSMARSPPTCEGLFAAGDCRRGQSLVVWAINEGRGAARAIDQFLMGTSTLPAPGITQGLVAMT